MKWHPVMIRWCLSIYLKSPGIHSPSLLWTSSYTFIVVSSQRGLKISLNFITGIKTFEIFVGVTKEGVYILECDLCLYYVSHYTIMIPFLQEKMHFFWSGASVSFMTPVLLFPYIYI